MIFRMKCFVSQEGKKSYRTPSVLHLISGVEKFYA